MKKCILFCLLLAWMAVSFGQNCIDMLVYVYSVDGSETNTKTDTLYCKILSEDESGYTIDNGFAVSSLPKNIVTKVLPCCREMSPYEVYRFQGLDNVTMDYFTNNFNNVNTAGAALRKSAFNIYLATGLAIVGGTGMIMGLTVFKEKPSKPAWIVGGSVVTAAALFFAIRGWNQVYKAGKLLDLQNSELNLGLTQSGNLGLSLQF